MRRWVLLFWVIQAATCEEERDGDLLLPFPLTPLQPFSPIYDSIKNVECRNHAQKFLKDLKEMKIWALKMYDSSGKVSSGVLRGNIKWLGDEKECFSITSNPGGKEGAEDEIRGQYCTASIFMEPKNADGAKENSSQGTINEIFDMIHTHNPITSKYNESVLFFPTFSAMYIGLCIPHTCTPSDLRIALSEWLFPGNTSQVFGLDTNVVVYDDACMTEELKMSTKGKLALLFGVLITLVGIAGYIYESKMERQIKDGRQINERGLMMRVFLTFSFRRNLRNLLDMETPMDELSCIHGIRTIFTLLLYMIHKFIAIMFAAVANREDLTMYLSGPLSMMMRAFWGHVDTFVLLSGLLTAYYAFKKLEEGQRLNIIKMYLQRYMKFTPVFVIIVLWVESIADHMMTESQYLHFGKFLTDRCKKKWFNILTYTNALHGSNEMCYINAHQLETDMHMYLLTPFIILFLWKMPKTAIMSILGSMASLSYLKYNVVKTEEITTVLPHGGLVSQMEKGADKLYLNFIYRLVPYLSGILLAYYLRIRDKKRKLPKVILFVGSVFALWCANYSFLSLVHLSRPGCTYDATEGAIYGALQPLLWSFAISWFLYICITGQAELINRFLSWRGFLISSRLAYAFYVCQMGIMVGEVAANPTPITLSPATMIDLNTMAKVLLATVWLTLLFVMPFKDLWEIMNAALNKNSEKKED